MPTEYAHVTYARYLRDVLPRVFSDERESGRRGAEVVVWIVGLCTGLLTLLFAGWDRVDFLSEGAATTVAVLLGVVIVLGVSQRMVQHLGERAIRTLEIEAVGWIFGFTDDARSPAWLFEGWDQEEIVERFQTEFGLDYRFLAESGASLEACRSAYQAQYDLWKKSDKEGQGDLLEFTCAVFGMPAEGSREIPSERDPSDDPHRRLRGLGRAVEKRLALTQHLLLATGIGFITVVVIVVTCALRTLLGG